MNKSESIGALVAALAKAHEEFKPILKTATNPFFSSKYATLDAILESVSLPLAKNGLTVLQVPEGEELTTTLVHSSGEWVSSSYGLHATKQDPQSMGSAITYARRYTLAAILGVAAEADDDGNAASAPAKASGKSAPQERPVGDGAGGQAWKAPSWFEGPHVLSDCAPSELEKLASSYERTLTNPEKAKWHDRARVDLSLVRQEQDRRKEVGKQVDEDGKKLPF